MNPEIVVLFLTILTGPGKQDIHYHMDMPNLEACLEQEAKFLRHKVPIEVGGKRLRAGCDVPMPEEETP